MSQVGGIGSLVEFNLNQPGATPAKKSLGQQDFLRLMVAQIQNQDPLDPQTNGDFIAQLAQFSATDGIGKMQNSLQDLATSLQSNQALQASALVGRKVLVKSEYMTLGESGSTKAAVDLAPGVSDLKASVYSSTGELIKTFNLNNTGSELYEFTWDGTNQKGERAPAGSYSIKVNGRYGGNEVALKTMTVSNVDSVSLGQNGEGVLLNVAGVGPVSLNDIRQITG